MATQEHTDHEARIARIDELNEQLWHYRTVQTDQKEAEQMLEEVAGMLSDFDYPVGHAQHKLNSAMAVFIIKQQPALAIKQLHEALDHFRQINNTRWISNTYMTIAIIQNTLINTEQAMYNGLKGIDHFDSGRGDASDSIMAFYVMGTIYKDIKQFNDAEAYYQKGLTISGSRTTMWKGRIYAGLTSIYTLQQKYGSAIDAGLKGLGILRKENNIIGIGRVLNEIGSIYKKQKDYDKALTYFFEALELRHNTQFALGSLMDIAETYSETGELSQAMQYLQKAEALALQVKTSVKLASIYKRAGEIQKTAGHYREALDYYEKYVNLKIEQAGRENEIKLSNLKSAVIEEKEKEIEHLKNVELKNAYKIISEKNKEVTDSINYARRIQHSFIMQGHELIRNIPGSFVVFRPKDIVSGDFYWAAYSEKGLMYLAVCDSTGHGVPGAFMSLLNTSFLNESIKEQHIARPNEVLDHVRQRLIESLSQEGGKDGMDAILICYDKQRQSLTYAASNNAPLLIKSDGTLLNLPCDKMPVGKGERDQNFTLYTIAHEPGDRLYLYTDGYADQFGGPKGKKFKYRQLEELLQSASRLSPSEQKDLLETTFDAWKGDLEQVDDVCLIGIKL